MFRLLLPMLTVTVLCVTANQAKIMRNNALMNKMVTHFQDNHVGEAPSEQRENKKRPEKVLSIMQTVLCRNFPTIPCELIVEDETLRILIEKSIQQIQYKRLMMEKTTVKPGYPLTLFPSLVNSEDLSNFLQVRDSNIYGKDKKKDERNSKKRKSKKNYATGHWSKESPTKENRKQPKRQKSESKKKNVYSGRKLRKFYPHKVKYKDKADTHPVIESDEKMSLSVEGPDVGINNKRHNTMDFKQGPEDPVWRIDYMKHGEPRLNKLGYGSENMNVKFTKTGPNVIVDEGLLEQGARKDVLHPDVYIKKNFVRKNVDNSEGAE